MSPKRLIPPDLTGLEPSLAIPFLSATVSTWPLTDVERAALLGCTPEEWARWQTTPPASLDDETWARLNECTAIGALCVGLLPARVCQGRHVLEVPGTASDGVGAAVDVLRTGTLDALRAVRVRLQSCVDLGD